MYDDDIILLKDGFSEKLPTLKINLEYLIDQTLNVGLDFDSVNKYFLITK